MHKDKYQVSRQLEQGKVSDTWRLYYKHISMQNITTTRPGQMIQRYNFQHIPTMTIIYYYYYALISIEMYTMHGSVKGDKIIKMRENTRKYINMGDVCVFQNTKYSSVRPTIWNALKCTTPSENVCITL